MKLHLKVSLCHGKYLGRWKPKHTCITNIFWTPCLRKLQAQRAMWTDLWLRKSSSGSAVVGLKTCVQESGVRLVCLGKTRVLGIPERYQPGDWMGHGLSYGILYGVWFPCPAALQHWDEFLLSQVIIRLLPLSLLFQESLRTESCLHNPNVPTLYLKGSHFHTVCGFSTAPKKILWKAKP